MRVLLSLWCFQILPSVARAQTQRAAPWGSGKRQPAPQTCATRRGAHGEPQSARPSRRAGGRGARAVWKAPRRFTLSMCPCAGAAAPLPGAHPAGASVSMRSRVHACSTVFGAALRTTAPRWEQPERL